MTDPAPGFHYDGFCSRDQLAVLLDAVAGLPLSDAERRTLYWLSGWETGTVETLAALLTRARHAGPHRGAAASATESPRCGRCHRTPPQAGSRFCAACIDRCHAATEFDHRCAVCSEVSPS